MTPDKFCLSDRDTGSSLALRQVNSYPSSAAFFQGTSPVQSFSGAPCLRRVLRPSLSATLGFCSRAPPIVPMVQGLKETLAQQWTQETSGCSERILWTQRKGQSPRLYVLVAEVQNKHQNSPLFFFFLQICTTIFFWLEWFDPSLYSLTHCTHLYWVPDLYSNGAGRQVQDPCLQ